MILMNIIALNRAFLLGVNVSARDQFLYSLR